MSTDWKQRWQGKWALITGASAGIGLELAKLLALLLPLVGPAHDGQGLVGPRLEESGHDLLGPLRLA